MDDLRNHDPKPTAHEREWLATNPVQAMMTFTLMTAVALMIGVAAANLISSAGASTPASTLSASR